MTFGGASLVKNNTSYQLQATNLLKTIREQFDKNTDQPWTSTLKYYQYFVRRFFVDPEFNLGGDNGRGLLVSHVMGLGKTRLAVAVAMSLWDVYEPLVLLPKSLQVNFEKTVVSVVRLLNQGKSQEEIGRLIGHAKKRFHFISTNASNAGQKIASAKLRKRVIIVDEAHNLFRAIINGGKNARAIYDAIMGERDLRLVFLTGTPCSKDPFEIVPCFNMLMGYDILPTRYDHFNEFFIDSHLNKIKNGGFLANRLFGLVSYASMEVDKEAYRKHFPELLPMKVEKCEMTVNQFGKYMMARQREREETAESEGVEQINAPVLAPMSLPSSDKSFGTYYVKSRMISNFCDGESPKFERLLKNVQESEGPVVVYSQFVEEGGLGSLKTFLKKHQLSFSEITGKVSADQQRGIVLSFNSADNAHGERIKALLISKTGAEGLNLKRVRQVHILEPYWDWSRHDQVEARAVRLDSHVDLPENERRVQSFIYIAVGNQRMLDEMPTRVRKEEQETVDELFYRRAWKKHQLNLSMRELLKTISLECSTLGLSGCVVCQPTDERLFSNDVRRDLRSVNPCKKMQETQVEVKKISHDGVTYYYREADNPLGYEFYRYNDSVQSLVSIDHSDPIITDLVELVDPFKY